MGWWLNQGTPKNERPLRWRHVPRSWIYNLLPLPNRNSITRAELNPSWLQLMIACLSPVGLGISLKLKAIRQTFWAYGYHNRMCEVLQEVLSNFSLTPAFFVYRKRAFNEIWLANMRRKNASRIYFFDSHRYSSSHCLNPHKSTIDPYM